MKGKVLPFITTFLTFCIVFLVWYGWNLDSRQIFEMIFIGTLSSLFFPFANNQVIRLIQYVLRKK